MKLSTYETQVLDLLTQDPNFCVQMGLEKNLNALPDPGKNARLKKQGKIKMLQNLLDQVEAENEEQKIDKKLWFRYLEQHRLSLDLEIDNVPKNMRMPVAFREIVDPIFLLFINDPREPKFRLVNIMSRLNKVPEYIQSYVRNLREPVKRWLEMELASLDGSKDFFESIIAWAKEVEFERVDALEQSVNKALSSLQYYRNFLLDCPTVDNIFLGEDQMKKVLYARGIELDPMEIHKIAKDFLKDNRDEVEQLRSRLVKKYQLEANTTATDLQLFLAEKFKVQNQSDDFSDVIKRYEAEQERILKWMKEKDLFPIPEEQSLSIMRTPRFMEPTIPAGAMLCPLALRDGEKKSVIYLTLRPDLLDEHTELSIPNMMIHEGIPGHHLQLAWATTHKSLIRKMFNANDLAEGWTTMLEDVVLDLGYCSELADEVRFSAKRDIARLGARVAIDLYFMSGDKNYLNVGVDCDLSSEDPFEAAGNLLAAVTGFVPSRVQGELNWYSQESGYPLSYLVGNHLMLKLKQDFLGNEGNTLRDFHHFILRQGKTPIFFIKA